MIQNKAIAETLGPVEALHDMLSSWPHGDDANPFAIARMIREAYDLGRLQGKAESCDVVNEIAEAQPFDASLLRDVSAAIRAK